MWAVAGKAVLGLLPKAGQAIKGLFSTKLTVGSSLAMSAGLAAAPVGIAALDNLTGNALSEGIIHNLDKLPFSETLEAILRLDETVKGQIAQPISNGIIEGLKESDRARGRIALNEGEEGYKRTKLIADAVAHLVIGDVVGAASKASTLGIEQADLVSAYNQAKADNPDATLPEIFMATFVSIEQKALENRQNMQASQSVPARVQQTPQTPAPPATSSSSGDKEFSLCNLSAVQLNTAFNSVAEHSGFMGMLYKGASFLAGLFGQQANFQKFIISQSDAEIKKVALQAAAAAGQVTSRLGIPDFGIPQPAHGPTLAI